jgi:hypothetical protein
VYQLRIGRTTLVDPDDAAVIAAVAAAAGRPPAERAAAARAAAPPLDFRGLFAAAATRQGGGRDAPVFREGDTIVPYVGDLLTVQQIDALYGPHGLAPYPASVGATGARAANRWEVDGALLRGAANFANSCRAANARTQACTQNASIKVVPGSYPRLMATQNIYDGDEIFVRYGRNYWDVSEGSQGGSFENRGAVTRIGGR